jgi:hypothetical protein
MRNYKKSRQAEIAHALTERELAYISRAIFRQRIDKPDDEPELASKLDPLISLARQQKIPI